METEAPAAGEITNARSLIDEEGAVIQLSTIAPPPDDEVTHL